MMVAATVEGKLYLVGGGSIVLTRICLCMTRIRTRLSTKANLPTRRMQSAAAAIDGKLYVVGGKVNGGNSK